eukprot:CAMPEP_0179215192 /NCGR_PEP_ID=MMETSP0797-20121207/2724_1 /TAXON_ID=47934 /ORGANISM="Dinophysis acuminata, Strain DAEP01" /LENGTH=275 /DNA_ID=CAMNT_0020921287 /DNA_START=10 /DNA_END=837 /DNA_ORIENTATION=+
MCKEDPLKHMGSKRTWRDTFSQPGGCARRVFRCSPTVYFRARAMLALIWLSCTALSFADDSGNPKWLAYLTHWCAMVESLYFIFAAYSTYHAIYSEIRDEVDHVAPWFVRLTQSLWAAAPTMALLVVALYWGLVWRPPNRAGGAVGLIEHGGNLIVVLVDIAMNCQPLYFSDVYVTITIGVLYMVLTVIWWACSGDKLYSIVNWGGAPLQTALLFIVAIGISIPLVHFLLVALVSKLRRWDEPCATSSPTLPPPQQAEAPLGEDGGDPGPVVASV